MNIEKVSVDIGKLVKNGSKSDLVEIYKSEIELLDMQRGNFLSELLHRTANKINYEKEPEGRDEWQSADYTLIKNKGDCEDFTILIGGVLLCAGYPVLLKFTAGGDEFDHVYPMSWDGKAWVALDATLKTIGLDFEGSYSKSVIYSLEGAAVKVSELSPFTWLGWFMLAAVLLIIFLRAMVGG